MLVQHQVLLDPGDMLVVLDFKEVLDLRAVLVQHQDLQVVLVLAVLDTLAAQV